MLILVLALSAWAADVRTVEVCPVTSAEEPAVAARVLLGGEDEPGPPETGCRELGAHAIGDELNLLVTAPGKAPVLVAHRVRRRRNVVQVVLPTLEVDRDPGDDVPIMVHGYGEPPPPCPADAGRREGCVCFQTRTSRYMSPSCVTAPAPRSAR